MIILCVEDESFLLNDMVEELRFAGYDVMEASNGVDAMSRLEDRRPDLVLSDVSMPLMNGCELLARLRSDKGNLSKTPIVLMTAFDESEVARRCSASPDAVIRKPIDYCELLTTLRRFHPTE
jgi:CheY-like chemotaxis protein